MNKTDIKNQLRKMSKIERDDIRLFIEYLDLSESNNQIDSELLDELDKRKREVENGSMTLHDAKEFVSEWRKRI